MMDRWLELAYPDEAYRAEVRAGWMGLVEKALTSGQVGQEIERRAYRVTCKDGTVKTTVIFGVIVAARVFVMFEDTTEIKRAEEALRESEGNRETFRGLSEGVFEAIFISEAGKCLHQNRRAEEMFGYSTEEAVGRLGTDWIVPEDRNRVMNNMLSGYELPYEATGLRKDGSTFPALLVGKMMDFRGRTVRVTSMTDITVRKQAEEALNTASGLLRSLLESAGDVIAMMDSDYRFVLFNTAFHDECKRIYGVSFKPGDSMLQALAHLPEDLANAMAYWNRALAGEDFTVAQQFGDPRLARSWYELHFSPIRDDRGKVVGAVHIVRNVTERRVLEEALQEANVRLSLAMDQARLSYWEMDAATSTFTFNDRFYALYGTTAVREGGYQMAAAVYAREFLPLEEEHLVADSVGLLLAGDIDELQREHRIRRRDGELRDILVRINVVRDATGQVVGTRGTNQDITERKQAEEQLHRLNRELRAVSLCNQAMVRATDEQALLSEVCRIICDEARYRLAWVAYVDQDIARTARAAAWAGVDSGYIAQVLVTWSEDPASLSGPVGEAIKTGEVVTVEDIENDPRMGRYREAALRRGLRSGAVLPLKDASDVAFGALIVYSAEANVISPDEVRLLRELAGDLAFGISVLRSRVAHKAAEELLRHSTERYRLLFDQAGDYILVLEIVADGPPIIQEANQAALRALGYSRDELLGKPISFVEAELTLDVIQKRRRQVVDRQTQTTAFEVRHRRKDGTFFDAEVRAREVRIEGRILSIAVHRDITERKRAEEALRASSRYSRSLIESSLDPLVTISAEGKISDVNLATEKVTGVCRDCLIGSDFAEYFTEPELARAGYLKVFERGQVVDYPLAIRHASGAITDVLYNASIYRDERGEAVGVFAAARDITEHKRANDLLRKSERDLLASQRMARMGSYSLDLPREMFQISDVLDELFGIDKVYDHSMAGWGALLHPDDRSMMLDYLHNDVLGRLQPFDKEFRIVRHNDKAMRWLHAVGKLELDANGRPVMIVGTCQDITERKRAEQEREKLEEQLRVSQKMEAIGSLAGGVAHDFNNLLSVILSYTSFAMDGIPEDDPRRNNLLEVKKAGERAAALTRQLLAFSRKQVLQPVALDLNAIAVGVEKMLRRILGEDIDLIQVLAPDLGLVKADPGQIEQIMMNLVVNARDAMTEGGKLTIETSNVEIDEEYGARHVALAPGSYVQLAFTDTGCGMDAQTKARLFEPFFTTKEKGKGTGLGLSTVYGIVKQSGGDIWVYSELGHGTTFRIYLPRDLSAMAATTIKPKTVTIRTGGVETVLVVEDEAALRAIAQRALVVAGYKVLIAADGNEALQICAQHPGNIHLLLTDVIMPGMNGRVLAQRVLKMRPTLKVVYMSGYTDNAIIHHGVLDAGMHFLAKPFVPSSLTRKVREVLDSGITHLGDGPEAAEGDAEDKRPVVKDLLSSIAPDVLAKLRKAVIAARYNEIVRIVETFRSTEPRLATELMRMVDLFDYDGIRDILSE